MSLFMEYRGRYRIFDSRRIATYPIATRTNKVRREHLLLPGELPPAAPPTSERLAAAIGRVAGAVLSARSAGRPVILFTGGHLIKNGMGPLLSDLVERGLVSLVAGTVATAIHDFELALIGETSEYVPKALEAGQFGMAYEFAYLNTAMQLGHRQQLGLGECLGRAICDPAFFGDILRIAGRPGAPRSFAHPEFSVLAACYRCGVPMTIHAGIGTDVCDQHPSFDGEAKGGTSGRDFLIYAHEVEQLGSGGVVLNIGSAVTGPEVFLKAASMAGNTGSAPQHLVTADFDLRPFRRSRMTDESQAGYYFRDQKSIVVRVPEAFRGRGHYIRGDMNKTFLMLYRNLTGT
jgi:hypothetical protein